MLGAQGNYEWSVPCFRIMSRDGYQRGGVLPMAFEVHECIEKSRMKELDDEMRG